MRKLERFAVRKPVLFGVLMIVAWSVLSALTYPLHFLFPDNDVGLRYGDGVSKAAISVLIVLLLWRLGWLGRAGIARSVSRRDWLVISILGVYLVGTVLFAFTGSFAPVVASTPAAIAEFVVTLPGALTEELLFRGLILIAMLNAWGRKPYGVAKSIVVSSLMFGATHMLNVLVRPAGIVIFQALVVSLPGMLYGAILLKMRSLWPAILIHWLTNAAVNVKVVELASWHADAIDVVVAGPVPHPADSLYRLSTLDDARW